MGLVAFNQSCWHRLSVRTPYGIHDGDEAGMDTNSRETHWARSNLSLRAKWGFGSCGKSRSLGIPYPTFRGPELRILVRKAHPPYGYPHSSRVHSLLKIARFPKQNKRRTLKDFAPVRPAKLRFYSSRFSRFSYIQKQKRHHVQLYMSISPCPYDVGLQSPN